MRTQGYTCPHGQDLHGGKMSSVLSEKHSPAMRVQPPSAASVQLDVNGKNVSEPREESKCAASFKMGFSWVWQPHPEATEGTYRIVTAGVQVDEMVHRTKEMEFSNFSWLSGRFGNVCVYVPAKGQGNIPTAALRCEQAKLRYENIHKHWLFAWK